MAPILLSSFPQSRYSTSDAPVTTPRSLSQSPAARGDHGLPHAGSSRPAIGGRRGAAVRFSGSATGVLFPFFAPILGWLRVFISGSDTSSNALFCKLQSATAVSIGVNPVVTVGANLSGSVIGKMISPQSIAVAAAAGGPVGRESDLFRFTIRHSLILLFIICCIVLALTYLFKWMIPVYFYHL